MDMDAALATYIVESRELLEEMEDALLRLEQEADKDELLNAIFRAAHTIKGSAGLFGLDIIVDFTHGAESLLDKLRDGELAITEDMIALLLACRDHIAVLINHVEEGGEQLNDSTLARGDELSEKLQRAGAATLTKTAEVSVPEILEGEVGRLDDHIVTTDNWHISLRFGPDSLRDGLDPISFLRYLGTIGRVVNVITLDDRLPALGEMDPEACYLGFEISLSSDADKQTIESVFDFVREDSFVRILAPSSRIFEYIDLIQDLPEEDMYLGEILVRSGSLTQKELNDALAKQESLKQEAINQQLGSIVLDEGLTSQAVLNAAVEKQDKVRQVNTREAQSIRVDAVKLDQLINLIGELVIASAGTSLNAMAIGNGSLIESVSTLTRLTEEVRDSALNLRMVQIGATFNRFQRVVRDVSKELDKEIELVITGAETELDKTVVEKIGDPLMHLVRNSIDHGIESPEQRIAQGKQAKGKLQLNAHHDSGSIVIEISDDGAGLNRDRILQKAISRGLLEEGAQLTDQEIYNLIFEAGFSTADEVTNLSGRGVGMDVVRRNITELRGSIELESSLGQGTTTRIRMPLTLAIIDGFLVSVEDSSFVVPLDMVLECVEFNEVSRSKSVDSQFINLRGEVLPYIRLRNLFGVAGKPTGRENVVVVQYAGLKAGLVVDELVGEFQTVIKPLGNIFSHIRGIGGSTILGNGEVALIIDVPGLVREASSMKNNFVGTAA